MVGTAAASVVSNPQRPQFGILSGANNYNNNNGMLRPLTNQLGTKHQMLGKGQQLQQHQQPLQQKQQQQQQQQQEEEEEVKPLLAPTLTRAPDGTVLPKRYLSSLETHLRTDRTISLLLLEAGATVTTTAPPTTADAASPVPTTPAVALSPTAMTPRAEGSATPSAPAATVVTFAGQLPLSLTKERVMNAINSLDAGLKAFVETTEKVEKELPQLKQAAAALRAKRILQLEKKAAAEQAVRERLIALAAAAAAAAAVKAADDEQGNSAQAASTASAVAAAAAAEATVESGEVVFPLFPLFSGADSANITPETLSNQIFVSKDGASIAMHILRLAASWTPNASWFSQNTFSDSAKSESYIKGQANGADTLLLSGERVSLSSREESSDSDVVMDGSSQTSTTPSTMAATAAISTKSASDLYGFGGLQLTSAPPPPPPPPPSSSTLMTPARAAVPSSSMADSDDIVSLQKKGADKVDKKESETSYERSLALQRFLKRTSVEKLFSFLSSSLSRIQKSDEDARFILFDDCEGAEIPVTEKDLLIASGAPAAFNISSSSSSFSSSNLVMAASKNVSCVIRLHTTLPFNLLAPSDDSISSVSSTEALVEAALKGKMTLRLSAELPRVAVFAFRPTGFTNPASVIYATVTASMADMAKVSSAFVTPPQHSMMRFVSKRKAAAALTASATDPALTSSAPPPGVLLPLSPLLEHAAAWEAAEESRATVMLENRGKSVLSHLPMLVLARKSALASSRSSIMNSNSTDSATLYVPSKLRSKVFFTGNSLVTKRLISSINDAYLASNENMDVFDVSDAVSGNSNALLELEEKVRSTLLEASATGDDSLDVTALALLSALVIEASGSVDKHALNASIKRQEHNARRHASIRARMSKTLLVRRSILRSQSVALGAEYVRSYSAWTSRCREQGRLRKLRSLEAAARKRAGFGLDIDLIPQDSPRDTGRHRRGGIEGDGASSSRSAAAERDATVAADTDLPSDSEGEDLNFGEGDVVRSEWEMQQKLEQLGRRERLATMRLYQTAVLPDLLPHAPNDLARTIKSFGVGQSGRLTTDGAPMLCSHLPPRVSCSSLLRPSPQQIVLTSPAEVIDASSHSRLSGEATIPSLLGRRSRPQLQDTRLDLDENEFSGAIETTHNPLWFGACNCPVSVEIASRNINPWSDTEKLIFCDRFMQTPKDFGSIAAGLPNKTAGDCIAFYYLTKNVAGYKWKIKAQANGLKRKLHTTIGWVQACGAARDIGVPIHADVVRGGVLKESSGAKKVVVASVRVGDLSYSRTFLHPGPYARVTALHRIVSAPLPLSTIPPATAPVVQVAALSQIAQGANKLTPGIGGGGGGGVGGQSSILGNSSALVSVSTPKRSNTFSSESGLQSPTSGSTHVDALGMSEKVILASAASSASAMLGFTPSTLAQAGVSSPTSSQLVVPKDARNEFIYMYGTGASSLPWSYKFSDRVNGEDDPDPLVGQIPNSAQLLAGAGSGIGGSLVRVYENADKMFRANTSGKKERSGVSSSSYSDSKAGKEPSLEQHNERLVNLLTKAWSSGSRSALRKAASELAVSGFVGASQAHERLVGRLVPPSTQPQYSSSFGTAGQGTGAGSLARFPLSPQTTQQAADFIVYTLFPLLCSLAGAIQTQPSKQSSVVKQLLLPLSSLDDDRYIGFMWRLLAASSDRRSFNISMKSLAQSLSGLQVGDSLLPSPPPPTPSALATVFPFVDKLHLSSLRFDTANSTSEQDEDEGQKRSKIIKVDLTGKSDGSDVSRSASGSTSYALPAVAEAEPAASKLVIAVTQPTALDHLPSRVRDVLANQIPSIRSLMLFLINSSYSASAELSATTAALSAKSAAEAAAAAAKEAADAAEASLQAQSPSASAGAEKEKEKKKASSKKASSSSPEGIAEAALTQLALPSHGPVALLSTGSYFLPNGPVSTLRYFDPMASPNVYQGFGEIEGIWPHSDLVNESLACDRAAVLSARCARLLYRRAGQRTRPPPHLRLDSDFVKGRSAGKSAAGDGEDDDDLDLLSRKDIEEILGEPKAVGIARRAAAAAAASAAANTVEVDEPGNHLMDIEYGAEAYASILDGTFESRLPVLPAPPAEPIDLNNPETLAKWSEHDKLVLSWCLGQHGRDWSAISDVLGTKSASQVNSYFAKYHSTRDLDEILAIREREINLREAALLSQRIQGAQEAPSEEFEADQGAAPVSYDGQPQVLQGQGDEELVGDGHMQTVLEGSEGNEEYASYEGQDGASHYALGQQQEVLDRQEVYADEDPNAQAYYEAQGGNEAVNSADGQTEGDLHVLPLADGVDEQVSTTYFEDEGVGEEGGGYGEGEGGPVEGGSVEGQMEEDGSGGEGNWQQQDVLVDSDGVPVQGLMGAGDGSGVQFEQYRDQHQQWGDEEQQAEYQVDDDFGGATLETKEMEVDEDGSEREESASEQEDS